jgi:DnaJ homolog subfamily C member 11
MVSEESAGISQSELMTYHSTGLIIVSAHYGLSSCFTPHGMSETEGRQDKIEDVTVPVQALVNNGHLFIPGGRAKFNILGFYVS